MPNNEANRQHRTVDKGARQVGATDAGRIEASASQLAEQHAVSQPPQEGIPLLDRLQDIERLLQAAYEYFSQVSETQGPRRTQDQRPRTQDQRPRTQGQRPPYAAEWLLDNFHVVRQSVRQIRQDMPAGYYRRLPKLTADARSKSADAGSTSAAALIGFPRVYALACALIRYDEGRLDLDRVTRFVQSYQRVAPLTMGELWALPTMLRLGLLELLAWAVARTAELDADVPQDLSTAICLPDDSSNDTVVANCITGLHFLATQDWETFFENVSLVEEVLSSDPVDIYARMDFDTRDACRKVVEELAWATGYTEEDVAREAVDLARAHLAPEVAEVELCDAPGPITEARRIAHVGFYLLDEGRTQLEARLTYSPPWYVRPHRTHKRTHDQCPQCPRWLLDHATLAYIGAIGLLTSAIAAGLVGYASAVGGTPVQLVAAALLSLVPASAIAVNLVNSIVTHTVPSDTLPKMDFSRGIPAECRTMVVIPGFLSSEDEVASLLRQLELHFLSNTDPHLYFALLTDFADAPQEHMDRDDVLLEQAKAGIRALNRRYGNDSSAPFYLFHRRRLWNPGEEQWMGWERKRGKLMEFNRLLREDDGTPLQYEGKQRGALQYEGKQRGALQYEGKGRPQTVGSDTFIVKLGDLDVLPQIRYVITVDADTVLPRESARRLVATLAHPLNRAQFDPDSDQVTAGYTVLQPRTEVKPTSANRSPFSRIFSGDIGLDLYTRAVSDVYQDLFGEGIYVGKGIYDVDAFERSLAGRVPENALLSHDLFEGIHGRAALVTDIVLYEDYPPGYLAYAHRLHRWVRGDWQLLPWLFPRVPHAGEGNVHGRTTNVRGRTTNVRGRTTNVRGRTTKVRTQLSVLDRWKILDNMRRSLLQPALVALLVAGWLWLPGSAWLWTLVGAVADAGSLSALAIPLVSGPLVGDIIGRVVRRPQLSLGAAMPSLRIELLRWLLRLAFLLYEAVLMGDAIVTTLVRLTISRKRLLQWTTSAHTVRLFGKTRKLALSWQRMWVAPLLAIACAVSIALLNPQAAPAAAPILAGWLLSPWIAYRISLTEVKREPSLSADQVAYLRSLARRTWLYFEQFVGPDDHWLPPDHFQEQPRGVVAHRTSPTNVGLMLLSTLSAYELGYIGPMDLTLRLRAAFETLSELERHRGHFLNWYDTRTLKPLTPRYVSTVDSGNLAACLLALQQGLQAISDDPNSVEGSEATPVLRWERWRGLLDTLGVLAQVLEDLEVDRFEKQRAALLSHLFSIHQRVLGTRNAPERWFDLLGQLLDEDWPELERLLIALVDAAGSDLDVASLRDLRLWSEQVHHHLLSVQNELGLLVPWHRSLAQVPALLQEPPSEITRAWLTLKDILGPIPPLDGIAQVRRTAQEPLQRLKRMLDERAETDDVEQADLAQKARDWCEQLAKNLDSAQGTARSLSIGLRDLGDQARAIFDAMDFRFLFDARRQVFHIGYDLHSGDLSANYYDLLASEARIASLVAIAKGDVPQSHWLHMNRPLARVDGAPSLFQRRHSDGAPSLFQRRHFHMKGSGAAHSYGAPVLLSWNGSMFEYLMPPLLARAYEGTLLHQTYHAVVEYQIDYARSKGVPWGISESGYYRFDRNRNYQYQGFGVPGLGRKRGLGDDLVITPYASLLALSIRPQAVMDNVERLIEEHMLGHHGFYEALDYTPSRLPLGQERAIVRSHMSHHQGMILLALADYLEDEMMVRYFHSHPLIQSVELLLQEQIPQHVPVEDLQGEPIGATEVAYSDVDLGPWRASTDAICPQVHLLSNGQYGVLITAAGGGYSYYATDVAIPVEHRKSAQSLALTRWRADTTLDDWGTWIYVQDLASGDLWSASRQPTGSPAEEQADSDSASEILFHPYKAEFWRRNHGITLRTEVAVAPEDDVEVRRIVLTNQEGRPRHLALTSYAEVVLAPQATDRRHPAFNKLFVESKFLPQVNGLLFHRRARSAEEEPFYLVHLLLPEKRKDAGQYAASTYETDRARFVGRSRTARSPAALAAGAPQLSGTTGATLDPMMALSQEIKLEPHGEARLAYVTLVAGSREEALGLARRYRAWPRIERTFDQARAQSERELRGLGLDAADLEHFQKLLSVLLYPHEALRADRHKLEQNEKGQSGLWPYAISGDHPILLVRVSKEEEMALVQEVLQAHTYWRDRQMKVDLVILNQREEGYDQELQGRLSRLVTRMDGENWLDRPGGIFVLRAGHVGRDGQVLLETAARAVLDGGRGSLADQLAPLQKRPTRLPHFAPPIPSAYEDYATPPVDRPTDLLFDNGLGGFSADGREYVIYLQPDDHIPHDTKGSAATPAPWVNVVANPEFGFLVSESGAGYTWAGNSGENRLTPWRNDPVSDQPGEALYLRDEETAHVWSPTPLPAPARAPYLVRHGAGYTTFEHHSHGLKQRLRLFAATDAPVKVVQLRLENVWDRVRRITATFYAEWVLGTSRDVTQQYVVPEYDTKSGVLLARNAYSEEFGERVAFLAASKEPHGLTADRAEFLGRNGSLRCPAALERIGLSGTVRAGLDPCAALQIHLDLQPGETQEVVFLLGQGADRKEALELVERYRDSNQVARAWGDVHVLWDDLLGTVAVETPDPAMNVLLNRWLLYQALSCRVWARSAFYQSSGAFGFRDQLQDVMALVPIAPSEWRLRKDDGAPSERRLPKSYGAPQVAREHILRAACHQFEAGDVLHWWHPPSGRGVRTRITDDLLWLPFVTAYYVEATGDEAVLDEEIPFRVGDPLEPGQNERYGHYESTQDNYTLYEHCRRALERGMTSGPHGLPLMGTGDWNDGMNRVGIGGQGESVWLGWFLYAALTRFTSICRRMGDQEQATAYRERAGELRQALQEHAWDGAWYLRAFYDDGTPLGSAESDECRIDSIAQSWAVLSGAAGEDRAQQAMQSVVEELVQWDERLMLLFTPPFSNEGKQSGSFQYEGKRSGSFQYKGKRSDSIDQLGRDPGYIKGYPPGVRENGGQYTHAALWAVWAFAEMGQGDLAGELFRLLNPITHADTPEKVARYRTEPYVVAADVYSVEPHVGRGGWTWYTGSAGWMYRLGVDAILGLRKAGDTLQIDPCIPQDWAGYELNYHYGDTSYRINVENPDGVNQGVRQITLDSENLDNKRVPLTDDGNHHEVSVVMGKS